jgi:hypothetical protein
VTCTSSTVIGAGASNVAVATINVTPTQAGQIGNTATVSGGGDTSAGNNTSPPVNTTVSKVLPPPSFTPIPTLTPWTLSLLALLVVFVGFATRGRMKPK